MPTLDGIVSSFLAQALFWLVLGFLVWASYFPVRRRFDNFFGLRKSPHKVTILLSNLWNTEAGKGDRWGKIVSGEELDAARRMNNVLASASPGFPELVRGLVDNIWLKDKLEMRIEVSDEVYDEMSYSHNLIVVGSTNKNSARRYFIGSGQSRVRIEGESSDAPPSIHANPLGNRIVMRAGQNDIPVDIPAECSPAVIERFVSPVFPGSEDRVIFICAGRKSQDSRAAIRHLARHWKELHKDCNADGRLVKCLAIDAEGEVEYVIDPLKVHAYREKRADIA